MADSTVKFKADISQLKAEMQAASRAVKLANSEFKKATAGMDDWSGSADGLQAKIKQLNSTLEAQKKRIELANKEYEKTAEVYGENSAEADRAKISLNNYIAAMEKTEKELTQYEQELKDCEEGTGRFADATDDLDDATTQAADGFTVMKGALADLVADGIRLAINALKDLATETISVGMNFESAMSKVGAVSGASAEEIDLLTQKAKEMGETTIFSATESAEAFNYMAMAGWKTEDMLNGIEGIMNLAAASGSDLATTSDIVTDALTAMGYGAEDAGRLADVMAAASSNANTNVEMMGQTFQYAAPIIGALGMNMEDAAVAIGLMANAGIKGEKSGTALRSILTRLSAPPKECAEAMDELGISLTDSNGKMKSMDEVMSDLRKAFSGLSETEQTAAAKAIAGQEAMSGLLAIVNAAPADVDKLTDAVKNSAGAAENMANTMNDNLGGALTLLKSNIEGKMITVYENASDSIKKAVEAISEALNEVDWESFGQKVGKAIEKVVDLFIQMIKHAGAIAAVLKSVGTVLAATFVATKLLTFVSTIIQMVQTFKTLKVATEAATTAQKLLNLAQAATPVGLVAAAVAGLAAGLLMLAANSDDAVEATNNLTEAEKEQIEAVYEMADAYNETKNARDEAVSNIQNEYGYYEKLADELETLVDENGKVKEGYEERAQVITDTLNEAIGTEIELTNGVIQNYKDQKKAIDELIESKKAQAILSANEALYTEAIQHEEEARRQAADAEAIYKQKIDESNQAQAEAQKLANMTVEEYAKLNGYGKNLADAAEAMGKEQGQLNRKFEESKRGIYEARQAYQAAEETYIGYENTIKNYQGLSSAIISGDSEKINEALKNMVNSFIDAEHGTQRTLENQVKNATQNYESLKKAVEEGSDIVTQEMVDDAKEMVDKSVDELAKFEKQAAKEGEDGGKAYAKGISSTKGETETAAKSLNDSAVDGVQPDGRSETAGENFGQGYINGLGKKIKEAMNIGRNMSTGAVQGLDEGQDSHSPSAKTTKSGENFGQGFINGMDNKESAVFKKAFNLAKTAINALKQGQQEGSPSKITYKSGQYFVQGYINGMVSEQPLLLKTVRSIVQSIVKENNKIVKTAQSGIGSALKAMLNVNNFDFASASENASSKFANNFAKQLEFSLSKLQYQNNQKLKEFDTAVEKLQSESQAEQEKEQAKSDKRVEALQKKYDSTNDKNQKNAIKSQIDAEKNANKKRIEQIKTNYEKLIDQQKKSKEAYQEASQQMLNEYSKAMQEYQEAAQKLIDDTLNGISEKYTQRYNELIEKQNTLVDKLKNTGELFNVSSAGVITVNDLKEQTKAINDYTSKLQKIKSKVSSELFDQIATYDMKEGSAFMDQLLSMSAKDLEAYNKAYTEKMEAANKAGEKIYKKDFQQLAKDYKAEVKAAFKGLDKELSDMGAEAMKSFLSGLKKNTSYMSKEIKEVVSNLTKQFEGIKLGDDAALGFRSGVSLQGAVPKATTGSSTQNNTVNNNYNLVQNNTSPKPLTALQTYTARRQQISMLKAATS